VRSPTTCYLSYGVRTISDVLPKPAETPAGGPSSTLFPDLRTDINRYYTQLEEEKDIYSNSGRVAD
jgi:hypothetical protein